MLVSEENRKGKNGVENSREKSEKGMIRNEEFRQGGKEGGREFER